MILSSKNWISHWQVIVENTNKMQNQANSIKFAPLAFDNKFESAYLSRLNFLACVVEGVLSLCSDLRYWGCVIYSSLGLFSSLLAAPPS